MLSARNKPGPQRIRQRRSRRYLITLPGIHQMASHIEQVTWSLLRTQMPATSPNPTHEAEWEHTSISSKTTQSPDRMDWSSPYHSLSSTSWHRQQRPSLRPSITQLVKWCPYEMHSMKWDGPNQNHQSKQITQQQQDLSTTPSYSGRSRWFGCDYIGSGAVRHWDNFVFTGTKERTTWQITTPSIICQPTT